MKRSIVLILFAALVLLSIAGCSSEPDADSPDKDAAAPTESAPAGPTPFLNYDTLAEKAEKMETVAEAAEAMGLPMTLTVLDEVDGTKIAAVWASNEDVSQFLLVEYEDGTLVDIMVLETAEEAESEADPGTNDAQLAPLVEQVDVNGIDGYSIEKVDVPAVEGDDGTPEPGTGVTRRTAAVSWATGTILIKVMSEDRDVASLLTIAKGIEFTD